MARTHLENGHFNPGQRSLYGKNWIQSGESQVSRAALARRLTLRWQVALNRRRFHRPHRQVSVKLVRPKCLIWTPVTVALLFDKASVCHGEHGAWNMVNVFQKTSRGSRTWCGQFSSSKILEVRSSTEAGVESDITNAVTEMSVTPNQWNQCWMCDRAGQITHLFIVLSLILISFMWKKYCELIINLILSIIIIIMTLVTKCLAEPQNNTLTIIK